MNLKVPTLIIRLDKPYHLKHANDFRKSVHIPKMTFLDTYYQNANYKWP